MAIVGLDDGNFETKIAVVVSHDGVEDKKVKLNSIKTLVAFGEISNIKPDGSGIDNESDIYQFEGNFYTVLNRTSKSNIDVLDPRTTDYHTSVQNVIMVQHALKKMGIDESYDVVMVTGLPFNDFYMNSKRDMRSEKIASFNALWNQIKCRDGKKPPTLISHSIFAEGVATYIHNLYTVYHGEDTESEVSRVNQNSPIAIVDLGGRTLDIVTISVNGDGFSSRESTTVELGALDLNEDISKNIMDRFNIKHVLPSGIEKAISDKTYTVFGDAKDVSDIIDKNISMFSERVKLEVRRVIGDAVDLGLVLFVGGGSHIVRNKLEHMYPNIRWAESPQFSNALGLLKSAIYVFNSDNEELAKSFPSLMATAS